MQQGHADDPSHPPPPASVPSVPPQESKAKLDVFHQAHRTPTDDPTGLASKLTRKAQELLAARLALAARREARWDAERRLYVVGWRESQADFEDEPWREERLRSSVLGRRTCLVSVTRTQSGGLTARCCHPQCNAHEMPSSCIYAAFSGRPELADVGGRHTSSWQAAMTGMVSAPTLPSAWSGMSVRPDRLDFELAPASTRVVDESPGPQRWSAPAQTTDSEDGVGGVDAPERLSWDEDDDLDDDGDPGEAGVDLGQSPASSPLKLAQSRHTEYVKKHLPQTTVDAAVNALMRKLADEHKSRAVVATGPVEMVGNSTWQHKGTRRGGLKNRVTFIPPQSSVSDGPSA